MTAAGSFVLAPIAIVLSGIFCYRRPAVASVLAFGITGTYGSFQAFTGFSGASLIDILLVGLWTSLLITRLIQRRVQQQLIWPAIVVLGVYLGITLLAVISAPDVNAAFLSFRLSGWYIMAVILIAYAGWDRSTYQTVARGFVGFALFVGLYATYRYIVGPASAEFNLAQQVAGGYNVVDGELRTFGSFSAGHQLGFWTAAVAPFCLGAALAWQGRWRLIALAAVGFLGFALVASEVRGGLVGIAAGFVLVLALYQLAGSTAGFRLGRTAVIGATCVAILGGGLLFTAGAGGNLDRYTNIFNRDEDQAYVNRTLKWTEALEDIDEHPFGQGIGSASINPAIQGPYLSIANNALDNSYLKIAFEQGLAVMVLFAIAMLLLMMRLAGGVIRSKDPETAGIAMGAAGSLLATLVVFYAGLEIEDVISLGPWLIVGLGSAFLVGEQSAVLSREPVRVSREPSPIQPVRPARSTPA